MVNTLQKIATKPILLALTIIWAVLCILGAVPSIYSDCYYIWINPTFFYLIVSTVFSLLQIALIILAIVKLEEAQSRKFFLGAYLAVVLSNLIIPLLPYPGSEFSMNSFFSSLPNTLLSALPVILLYLALYKKRIWTTICCVFIAIAIPVSLVVMIFHGGPVAFVNAAEYSNTVLIQPIEPENTPIIITPHSSIPGIGEAINGEETSISVGHIQHPTVNLTPSGEGFVTVIDPSTNDLFNSGKFPPNNVGQPQNVIDALTPYSFPSLDKNFLYFCATISYLSSLLYMFIELLYLARFLPQKHDAKVTVAAPAPLSAEERLTALKEAHEAGTLTDEEYEAKKAEVLNSFQS